MELSEVTVFALIEEGGKVALIQQGGRAHGLWCLPGGHIDEGEMLEQAAVREAKEEAGLDIEVVENIATIQMNGKEYRSNSSKDQKTITVNIVKAKPLSWELHPGTDELDARWFTKEELEKLNFRWEFLGKFLEENI